MSKVKTLRVEDVKNLKADLLDFEGDVKDIHVVPANTKMDDIIAMLTCLTLWRVVPKKDDNLEKIGVQLDYHAVDPIKVTDINLEPDGPDSKDILFNGVIRIPKTPTGEKNVTETFFLDEVLADQWCREINEYTNRRVQVISDMLIKSLSMRQDIAKNSLS